METTKFETLSFGEVWSRTCKTMLRNFGTFITANLIATGMILLLLIGLAALSLPQLAKITAWERFDIAYGGFSAVMGSSVLLLLVSMFFCEQFSTALIFSATHEYVRGNKLSSKDAFSLARKNYLSVTKTLWALVLCSLGVGIAAIPLGILALIPVIGWLVLIGVSFSLDVLFQFSVCVAATEQRKAFGAIRFGASVTFMGGFFRTLLQMVLATVIVGGIFVALIAFAVPEMLGGQPFEMGQFVQVTSSGVFYIGIIIFWVGVSVIASFFTVFIYYLFANARNDMANRAYEKMLQAQNAQGESWEAYKADEERQRWEALSKGCIIFNPPR